MVTPNYPYVWYSVIGDTNPTTQVWEYATGAMVANNTANYLSWVANGGRSFQFVPQHPITAAVNNGSGLIRVTTDSTADFTTGDAWVIQNVGGTTEANGTWPVTVINSTQLDLQGSAFVHAFTSAGVIDRGSIQPTLAAMLASIDKFNQGQIPPPFLAVTSAVNYQMANTPPRLLYFTPTATGVTVKLPQMNLFGSLAMGRELLIYNAGGIPILVADVNGLGLMTPFGVLPGNALFSIHLTANTSTGGTFATAIILFPIEQSIGDSNTGLGNFSNESLITVFPLNAALTVPRTWTLPLAASCVQGSFILIKDNTGGISATNTLSVARNGADTINGAATSIVLNRAYDYLLLETDGISKWTIVGGKGSLASTDLSDLPIPVASGGTGNTTGQPSGTAGGYLSGTYPNPNVIKVLGVSTNTAAAAGNVGEYTSATGSTGSLSNNTATDICTVSLTAGDWDVWGAIEFNPTGGPATTLFRGWVNNGANTDPGAGERGALSYASGTVLAQNPGVMAPMRQMLLSGTTNISLGCLCVFSGGTSVTASGTIKARRRS